jgi:adenylate kinase family enzyme
MLSLGPNRPSRIVVLGCSGAGKSTLAEALAIKLGLPFVPTDEVYWLPDWTPAPASHVSAWIEVVTTEASWVLDGNFDAQREILWARAELAIWLDLPWMTTMWRVLSRNLRWWVRRTPIWGGLRMTLPKAWNGVRHAARSHAIKRRTYADLLAGFSNLQVIRVQSAGDLRRWIESL